MGVDRRHIDARQGDAIDFVDADHSVGAAGDGDAGREVGRGDAERGEVERVLAAPGLASKPMMVLAPKLGPNTKVSLLAPPSIPAVPPPSCKVSLPLPPLRVSTAAPVRPLLPVVLPP